MNEKYDIIIVGAGPSGIFCAYELKEKRPDLKILMIEKGRAIENRQCPKRRTRKCVNCQPCSITTGFAGAGAFSDGKLSLSPDVGGNLPEILGYDKACELIKESDAIYLKFGAEFEKRYIGQGPSENRTMLETLDLGWELLGLLPKEELDRIDTKLIEKYWKDTRETLETEE